MWCFFFAECLTCLEACVCLTGYFKLLKPLFLITERKEKVVKITAGIDKGFSKSQICSVRGEDQRLLGVLKSIKLYVDNTPGSSLLTVYDPNSVNGILIRQVMNIHNDKNLPISSSSSARKGTIDEVINYLENHPTPDDPIMRAKVDDIIKYLPPKPKPASKRKIFIGGKYSRKLKNIKQL